MFHQVQTIDSNLKHQKQAGQLYPITKKSKEQAKQRYNELALLTTN